MNSYKNYNFTGNFTSELLAAYMEAAKDADMYKGLNNYNRECLESANKENAKLHIEKEEIEKKFNESQEEFDALEKENIMLRTRVSELEEQNNPHCHFSADMDMCVDVPEGTCDIPMKA